MNDNRIYRLLLVAVLLQWSISLATSYTFHIVTSPAAPCPGEFIGEPCLTLQQYVSNPSISHGNITVLFETGTHSMSHAFSASNAHSYTLSGYNVSIECISNTVSFTLTSIQYLNITGLKLSNCGSFRISSNYTSFTELQFDYCGSFTIFSNYTFFTGSQYSNCGSIVTSGSTTIEWSNVILIRNSNVYFRNSEFLNMKNCSFTLIRANPSLYLSSIQNGSISYSSFTNNQFSDRYRSCSGGALYLDGSELSLYRNTFSNNHLNCRYRSYGGALYASNSRLVITKNTFFNNFATPQNSWNTSYGGAMYTFNCIVYLENNSFIQNAAAYYGGAIYMVNSHLTLVNTIFTNNTAGYNGGGLYFGNNNITITNCSLTGNRANSGGGMYIRNANSIVSSGNKYELNMAYTEGGGAYLLTINKNTISFNRFVGNTANSGGAISSRANLILNNTYFANNIARRYGGCIYTNSVPNISVIVTDCTLINNTATTEGGGAIYSNSRYSNVSVVSSRFSYNSASYCSVLDVDEYYHFSVNLTDSVFTHNTATGQLIGGGVACIRNASIDIIRSTFKHNYADLHGGVFYIDESVTSVEGSLFVNNSAAVDGGVFYTYVHASSYNIRGSQFTNNSAGDDGGVLFLGRVNSQVSIDESILSWNNAGDRGGVVAIIASSMFIEINITNIFNNTASFGGLISACNSEVTVLEGELFVSEDPVYSFCTLYDGDVTYFNITSPRDLDNTLPTSSPVPNVSITSSQVFQLSSTINSNTVSTEPYLSIASWLVSSSDTINSNVMSITPQFSSIHYESLTSLIVIKTNLVENSIINSMFTSMSKTNQIQTTAHDQLSGSLYSSVITTSKYMQELISTSTQMSRSSTLGDLNTDTSIDVIITPSSTSGCSQVFSSSQNLVFITSITLQDDFTSGVLTSSSELKSHTHSLEQSTPVVLATTRSLLKEEAAATDSEKVTPTMFKQPIINYNYYYNSLHGIINTALLCFLIVIVILVLAIGFFMYKYKFQGKYHTSSKQSKKESKLIFEAQSYSKKDDFNDLQEKEEIF